jgi:GntR family transcriptional regulator
LPVNNMLSFQKGRADKEAEEKLAIDRGAPIYRVRNLLKLGDKPIVHDEMVLPAALFPDLDGSVIGQRSGTIYGLYQSHYGINVVRTGERLSAAAAPARVARLLEVKSGTPLLMIKRVAFTYNDMPVELRTSWVNTEHHEYSNDLWKSANR